MVKLRNSFFRKQKHQQCDEMLSTFMKNTTVNKLKNKIINYSPKSSVSNCEQIALRAEMSFVFVDMTPFGQ